MGFPIGLKSPKSDERDKKITFFGVRKKKPKKRKWFFPQRTIEEV